MRASLASKRAGADFVKTSTGFSTGGATAEDVALMRAVVGSEIGVKASGGVRKLRRSEENGVRGGDANRRQRQRENHGAGRGVIVRAATRLRLNQYSATRRCGQNDRIS